MPRNCNVLGQREIKTLLRYGFLNHHVFLYSIIFFFRATLDPSLVFAADQLCVRGAVGSAMTDLSSLASAHGVLDAALIYATSKDDFGNNLYCYATRSGIQSPVFRVNPGDQLNITLKNDLPKDSKSPGMKVRKPRTACGSALMTKASNNMHFHGTYTKPECHQDEVVYTLVNPEDSFNYDLFFPQNHPPGLYAYHPHVHGNAQEAVLGGASGAIVVAGIENYQPAVAGLPEKIIILRDSPLAASASNDGPDKDLSINYIPIRYPDYVPAIFQIKPLETQFWRVLNGGSDTIINLALTYDGVLQPLKLVAIDGVPLDNQQPLTQYQISLGPMARAEFIVQGPSLDVENAVLATLKNDNGLLGAKEPYRPLAKLVANPNAKEAAYKIPPVSNAQLRKMDKAIELLSQAPTRTRKLYFSTSLALPIDLNNPVLFYLTVDGQKEKVFDPDNPPAIVTNLGAVEDWVIENRSPGVHVFHIHQLHFVPIEQNGVAVRGSSQQLMDEIIVPAWDGIHRYPSVKIRLDFRDPTSEGLFVYHCHLLGHEDLGMMAEIEVTNGTVASQANRSRDLLPSFIIGALAFFINYYQPFLQ